MIAEIEYIGWVVECCVDRPTRVLKDHVDSLAIPVHPEQRAVLEIQENEVYRAKKEGVASQDSLENQERLEQRYVLQWDVSLFDIGRGRRSIDVGT